jgi:uncharacterized protein (TIGR02646 family)
MFRKTYPDATYEEFENKDALRHPLLEDQGHLYCYCMRCISIGRMKIEHYRSQKRHRDLQLDWKNMLAACTGGEGSPPPQQTCDTRKGEEDLTVDPQSSNVEHLRGTDQPGFTFRIPNDGDVDGDVDGEITTVVGSRSGSGSGSGL